MLVAGLVIFFGIRYRRTARNPDSRQPSRLRHSARNPWTIIPTGLALIMFVWGAKVYMDQARPPDDALQIYVTSQSSGCGRPSTLAASAKSMNSISRSAFPYGSP